MLSCQSARTALEIQRRELPLDLVLEGEVELSGSPVLRWRRVVRVSRGSWSLSWQKNTISPPMLRLQPPGRGDLGEEKPPREEAARLLAEADDGRCLIRGHGFALASAGAGRGRARPGAPG